MSLVELIITMAIASVLLLAVSVTFTSTLRVSKVASSRTDATADVRLAMDTVARRLRVAVRPSGAPAVLQAASADRVVFWASLTTVPAAGPVVVMPTLVEYVTDPGTGCLLEALTAYSATDPADPWPVASRRARCLVPGRVVGAAALFRYYDSAEAPAPLDLVGGQLPEASLDRVRSVALALDVSSASFPGARPVRAQTRVTLTNRRTEDLSGRTG